MRYFKIAMSAILLLCLSARANSQSTEKLSERLIFALHSKAETSQHIAWVFMVDKGNAVNRQLVEAEKRLTAKNRARRLRHRRGRLVDEFDLAVSPQYSELIARNVTRIRHESRWLNAISVEATQSQLLKLAELACVSRIDLVRKNKSADPIQTKNAPPHLLTSAPGSQMIDYGLSLVQNQLIKVPTLHDMGLDGTGVIIAMLDAGFNFLEHEALDHINVIATRDFVNGGSNVDDVIGQMGDGSHGSWTLGVIAGFEEGKLVGPAYGASFILAKTENTEFERHIEEDNWVAAAEWADSLGADIISSSLGYRSGFTDDEIGYSSQDMDGKTAIVTIGAEIAAGRGILVVNSAGNDGPAALTENTLGAPCDGENVLCVGAVTSVGTLSSFSSSGPTSDGRIKPDIVAMGSAVLTVDHSKQGSYFLLNGTSFSCPLVAGTAALLLEAFPTATNSMLIEALQNTADNAAAPDNQFGWGLIDAEAAFQSLDALISSPVVEQFALFPAYPNPFNARTTIPYDLPERTQVELKIFNIIGQKIATLVNKSQAAGQYQIPWNGTNDARTEVSTGIYVYRLRTETRLESGKVLFLK